MDIFRHLCQSCNTLARGIVESCVSLDEVKILLKEDGEAKKFFRYSYVESHSYPRLKLAVDHKHKEFVSHPYCQQVIENHYFDHMNWEGRSFVSKALYLFVISAFGLLSVAGYMVVRVPSFYYGYYHTASEGYAFSDRDAEDMTRTQRFFKYLGSIKLTLDIPFNRFIFHSFCYGIFLIILTLTAMSPSSRPGAVTWNYIVIFVYTCGLSLRHIHILWRSSWKMISTFWLLYFAFLQILLNFSFLLKVTLSYCEHSELIENLELLVHSCYALATITAIMGILYWFQLNEKMGPIIIQLSHVITDFATNFMILITVYIAFLIGLFFLIFGWNSNIYDTEYKMDILKRLALAMGWAILNPGPIGLELPDLPLSINASINVSGHNPNFPHIPDLPNKSFSLRPVHAREIPAMKLPGNISIPGNWSIPEELVEFIDGAHRLRYNFITFTLYAFQIITVI